MTVRIKFFSTLRTALGRGESEVEIPGPRPAREIFLDLFEDRRVAEKFLTTVRFAVNCEFAAPNTMVTDGDEIAFIPPVSGG